jgi:hypothetical protein
MTLARELGQARVAQRGRYGSGFRERAFMLNEMLLPWTSCTRVLAMRLHVSKRASRP